MAIGDYNKIAQQPLQNAVLGQNDKGGVELREPLKAPSNWTKFKAALSNVPLLGKIGGLQDARRTVAEYPLKLENYQVTNRQVLSGFTRDLQTRFGEQVANMAMREARPVDGAPLSQRTVATILGNAERAEKHNMAQNNMAATRFLESPLAGGQRMRGETDMNGVFLDMGFELTRGGGGWQEALGPGGTKIVTELVMRAIKDHPDHGKGQITNKEISFAARDALRFLSDLKEDLSSAPDMTEEKMEDILSRVAGRGSEKSISAHAREIVIVERLGRHLDRTNTESMLGKIVAGLSTEREQAPPTDTVLKAIKDNIVEKLSYVIEAMPEQFDCDRDLGSVCEALDERLQGKVKTAVEEHMKALATLENSGDLMTEAQVGVLKDVAGTRRIDSVQVDQYQKIGNSLFSAMHKVSAYTQGIGPEVVFEGLREALKAFEDGVEEMKRHGDSTMWEAGSLASGDMTSQLLLEFSRFAAAKMSSEEAGTLLERLTGDEAKSLVKGMMMSGDMTVAGTMPMILTVMVQALAERAGEDTQVAIETSTSLTSGDAPGLKGLRGDLAIAIITSAPDDIDSRGVVSGSKNGKLVDKDFRSDSLTDKVSEIILDSVSSLEMPEDGWIPNQTVRDINRATFKIGGNEISGDTQELRLENFGKALEGVDPKVSTAIARCMNQESLNTLVGVANSTAFGEGNMMVGEMGASPIYEATLQEDGSWIVIGTLMQTPAILGTLNGEDTRIETDGVSLFSITFRITPDEMGGDPVTTIEGTQVLFAF